MGRKNIKVSIKKRAGSLVQSEEKSNKKEKIKIEPDIKFKEEKQILVTEKKKKIREGTKKEEEKIQSEIALSEGISILNRHKQQLREKRMERLKSLNEEQVEGVEEKGYKKRTLLLTVLFLLLLIIVYLFFSYGPIFGISIHKINGLEDANKVEIVTTDNDIYDTYHNELLVYSNQVLRTYNSDGKITWEYKITETFTPTIFIQGKYMAVVNNSNGTIYYFENKKEILNKKIDGEIQNVYMDATGNMAIEYSTTGYKKVVGVYTSKGKNLYNTYLSSGSIIDIKLQNQGKQLIIAQTNTTSFKVGIDIFSVDGTASENNIKQLAKIDNNFAYHLTIQKQNLIILLDDKLVSLNINTGNMTTIKEFDSSQILHIAPAENYYISVEKLLNSEEHLYKIETVRFDQTRISELDINNVPKYIKNSGLLNYLVYQDKLQVINKWGIEIKNVNITTPPKDIVVFDQEKSVGLIYTNKIYIVKL